jgi:hypothetical protein
MSDAIHGIIHGKTIELLDDPGMADGQRVEVLLRPLVVPDARDEVEGNPAHQTLWEMIQELAAGVPDEEFLKLPVDGAEQLDHYIYGSPKRPTS